jgi:hypothetical protein
MRERHRIVCERALEAFEGWRAAMARATGCTAAELRA